MGLRAGLDGCRKSRPPSGFDPRTVQLVASPYTDYATTMLSRLLLLLVAQRRQIKTNMKQQFFVTYPHSILQFYNFTNFTHP